MPRKSSGAAKGKVPVKQITAWSNSRFATYDQCPRKAKFQFIDRLPVTTNAAMQRGRDVHTLCEHLVKGNVDFGDSDAKVKKTLDGILGTKDDFTRFNGEGSMSDLETFQEELLQLRDLYEENGPIRVTVEDKWAFTSQWTSCEYFAKNCWVRLVIDAFVYNTETNCATIIDYKTGKVRDGYGIQLELYAAAAFAKFPQLEQVKTELWFLDSGDIIGGDEETGEGVYAQSDADRLMTEWSKRVRPMLNDKTFAPKPSYLCRWCDFSTNNGGSCEY